MKLATHGVCSIFLTFILLGVAPIDAFFIVAMMAGAVAPDILEALTRVKHRSKIFHNYLAAFILLFLGLWESWILGLGLGCLHHLVLDMTTKKGVFFFDKRLHGMLKTNEPIDNLAIIGLHAALAMPIMMGIVA